MSYIHVNQDDYSSMLQHNSDLTDQVRDLQQSNDLLRKRLRVAAKALLDIAKISEGRDLPSTESHMATVALRELTSPAQEDLK